MVSLQSHAQLGMSEPLPSQEIAQGDGNCRTDTSPFDNLKERFERLRLELEDKTTIIQQQEQKLANFEERAAKHFHQMRELEAELKRHKAAKFQRELYANDPLETELYTMSTIAQNTRDQMVAMRKLESFASKVESKQTRLDKTLIDESLHEINHIMKFLLSCHEHEPLLEPEISTNTDLQILTQASFKIPIITSASNSLFAPLDVLKVLVLTASRLWILETNWPDFDPSISLVLAKYRQIVHKYNGFRSLRNLDQAAYSLLLEDPDFEVKTIRKHAQDLALRFCKAVAPLFIQETEDLDFLSLKFWKNGNGSWENRHAGYRQIFKEVLKIKVATIQTTDLYCFQYDPLEPGISNKLVPTLVASCRPVPQFRNSTEEALLNLDNFPPTTPAVYKATDTADSPLDISENPIPSLVEPQAPKLYYSGLGSNGKKGIEAVGVEITGQNNQAQGRLTLNTEPAKERAICHNCQKSYSTLHGLRRHKSNSPACRQPLSDENTSENINNSLQQPEQYRSQASAQGISRSQTLILRKPLEIEKEQIKQTIFTGNPTSRDAGDTACQFCEKKYKRKDSRDRHAIGQHLTEILDDIDVFKVTQDFNYDTNPILPKEKRKAPFECDDLTTREFVRTNIIKSRPTKPFRTSKRQKTQVVEEISSETESHPGPESHATYGSNPTLPKPLKVPATKCRGKREDFFEVSGTRRTAKRQKTQSSIETINTESEVAQDPEFDSVLRFSHSKPARAPKIIIRGKQ